MTTLQEVQTTAKALGIKFHHRAGMAKIQGLIDAHSNPVDDGRHAEEVSKQWVLPKAEVIPMTKAKFDRDKLAANRRRATQLVRCMITNMHPEKKAWPGEIISVGSAKLGTFKKFVPFNTGEPYHLPRIIFDVLKDKECSSFFNKKNRQGHTVRRSRLIKEYALVELPRLTPKELEDLRIKQALAKGQA